MHLSAGSRVPDQRLEFLKGMLQTVTSQRRRDCDADKERDMRSSRVQHPEGLDAV